MAAAGAAGAAAFLARRLVVHQTYLVGLPGLRTAESVLLRENFVRRHCIFHFSLLVRFVWLR